MSRAKLSADTLVAAAVERDWDWLGGFKRVDVGDNELLRRVCTAKPTQRYCPRSTGSARR